MNKPVLRHYLPCRYGQVHLRSCDGGDTKPPLLCFHQVPNSSQVFEYVMPLLAEGRRVMAFDTPGFGMSDPGPDPQSIASYADALGDAIGELGLGDREVDLLGYHTGAAIAAELALGGRVRVRRIVLAAVPMLTAAERASLGALPPIPFDEDGNWARDEWRRSWRWRGPGQSRDSVLRTFAEKMRPGARERGANAIITYDMEAALRRLRPPLLMLRPRDDLWDATQRARDIRPDAGCVELPDLGHGMWDAAPQRLAAELALFLD